VQKGATEVRVKFGYTIIYVPNVAAAIDFYGRAFGLPTKFVHDSGQYGELDTGATTLAFASHALADGNLPGGYQRPDPSAPPFGIELAFVTSDVPAAVARASAAGAAVVVEAKAKPWGQVVAYVRAPEGTLIELCTSVGE
jgi:catechol 2,3-dioxygenase-like lactoylglutathione lyase family enzyme